MGSVGISQYGSSSPSQPATPPAQTNSSTSGPLSFDEYFKQNPINTTQELRPNIEFEGEMRDPAYVKAYSQYRENFNNPQPAAAAPQIPRVLDEQRQRFNPMMFRPMYGGLGGFPGMMGGGYGMGYGMGGYPRPFYGGFGGYGGYGGFGGYQNPMIGSFGPASNYYGNAPGPQTPYNPYPLMQSQTYTPYQQQFQQNNNANSSATAPALGTGSLSSLGGLGAYQAQFP